LAGAGVNQAAGRQLAIADLEDQIFLYVLFSTLWKILQALQGNIFILSFAIFFYILLFKMKSSSLFKAFNQLF
jgi:hypothetical protein